ncbi:FliK family flagellar hook-length control protein [Trabulsiella guamensis ATCC 49490]|uniref:FliK family flagellar hook-length control protein n=1 Tax=Trabulsiella guamensis ATCC 49490 TaxID=1005994 RepID=A0A085ASN0_9ENTR|nr:flagellar hook length control protein FliK [Trabulsiella guamensis]KFC13225.1 FliK family flagellar hook-length control protein [Trabulsiella guamensis ATCC 49490]
MITLPKLILSDTDTAAGQTAKLSGDAQDFLSLLAGALSGKGTGEGKTALTLADLQNVAAGLPKGDIKTSAQKLSQLLNQQDDAAALTDPNTLSDAQALLTSLTSRLAGVDASQAVAQVSNGKDALKNPADTSQLSDDELASLSALMAMLPQPQTVTAPRTVATNAAATTGASVPGLATATAARTGADNALPGITTQSHTKEPAQAAKGAENAAFAQTTPLAASAAVHAEADSTPTASASTTPLAPVMSHTTAQPAALPSAAAATVNAPLGSPDWQQSVSQHITMFTRQGQQTAELRLHPEELGQVHITLRMDDNQAQLQMVSPHSHVRAALEAALPVLRTQLADNGIQLGQSSISSESSSGQQQQQSFAQQQHASGSSGNGRLQAENDEAVLVPASLQSLSRGNGAVDIFA